MRRKFLLTLSIILGLCFLGGCSAKDGETNQGEPSNVVNIDDAGTEEAP